VPASGQADARENLLSSMFGAMIEEVTLAKRLLGHPVYSEEPHLTGGSPGHIESLERETSQVCQWLHALTGLVEPEPR
jgi:two-component system chemotaxis response regulator CheB